MKHPDYDYTHYSNATVDANGNLVHPWRDNTHLGNMGELVALFALLFIFIAVMAHIWRR